MHIIALYTSYIFYLIYLYNLSVYVYLLESMLIVMHGTDLKIVLVY